MAQFLISNYDEREKFKNQKKTQPVLNIAIA